MKMVLESLESKENDKILGVSDTPKPKKGGFRGAKTRQNFENFF